MVITDYNYEGEFKQKYSFKVRIEEANRIRVKYPDRIPIIVEHEKNSNIPILDKRKYLVPDDMTVGQFMYVIRKRISISPDTAIYMFFKQTLVPTNSEIGDIYNNNKDEDNFLYVIIGAEKTFG